MHERTTPAILARRVSEIPAESGRIYGYGLAFPLSALTFATLLVFPLAQRSDEIFILPIFLCAYIGGTGPGLLATLISMAGIALLDAMAVPPVVPTAALLELVLLFALGALVSVLSGNAKRARQRAEAAQRQLVDVVATAPGILYSFRLRRDGTTCVPFASDSIRSIFGIEAAVLAKDAAPVFRMMPPEDASRVQALITESAARLTIFRSDFRIRRPDGAMIWVEAVSRPSAEPDGSILWHGFINDITERKNLDLALRAARETLQTLIEQAPVSIAMLDADLRYLAASRRWIRDYGNGSADIVGRMHYEVIPDLPDEWRQLNAACLAGQPQSNEEELWVHANGVRSWLRWAMHPWRTGTGEVGGLIIYTEDITPRKLAEEKLQTSERRYRALVQNSPEAILVTRERLVTFANEAAVRMIAARSAEDVLGRNALSLVHPDDHSLVETARAAMRERGEYGTPLQHRAVRDDGTILEVETVASLIEDDDGIGTQFIVRDITERRKQQQALQASEERFRQVAESIREVFWLAELDGVTLQYVSPAYETVWGRTRESLLTNPSEWTDAIHAFDRDRVLTALPHASRGGYDVEYRVIRPDGSVRWIHDRGFPVFDEKGTAVRAAGVAEDITDRRELELQLRQAQKLESLGLLAGGVAHDFNNWLTVISANSELLRQFVAASNADARELIDEIAEAGNRAAGLTRQLLALSRQQVLEPRIVPINSVVLDAEKLLRRLIGEDISLETRLSSASQVRVDPGLMGQVLMNLVVNARDAMPTGGRLTIETADVRADDACTRKHPGTALRSHVRLTVTDTGTGMNAETKARVFDPFFTTKGIGHGTGLGLSVVHGIVQQSGGYIDVESTLGQGSTFDVLLPVVDAYSDGLQASSVHPRIGNETILLVEDEAVVRRVAARGLAGAGYTVIEAVDGIDAQERMLEYAGAFDLVITDVVMPRMGGRRFADSLPESIPVLYTSGYLDDAVVRHGVLQAEVAFLSKPYSVAELLLKVREVLEGSPMASRTA